MDTYEIFPSNEMTDEKHLYRVLKNNEYLQTALSHESAQNIILADMGTGKLAMVDNWQNDIALKSDLGWRQNPSRHLISSPDIF